MSVQPPKLPRGIRNNNPGNLRPGGPTWLGVAGSDMDQPDPPYLRFVDPEHGIRAIAMTLRSYEDRHGIHTLDQVFARWAPAGDRNDPERYAAQVAAALGKAAGESIDLHDVVVLTAIAKAIVHQECGDNAGQPWYPDAQIKAGVALAFPAFT